LLHAPVLTDPDRRVLMKRDTCPLERRKVPVIRSDPRFSHGRIGVGFGCATMRAELIA
jgi:hypothetical protein